MHWYFNWNFRLERKSPSALYRYNSECEAEAWLHFQFYLNYLADCSSKPSIHKCFRADRIVLEGNSTYDWVIDFLHLRRIHLLYSIISNYYFTSPIAIASIVPALLVNQGVKYPYLPGWDDHPYHLTFFRPNHFLTFCNAERRLAPQHLSFYWPSGLSLCLFTYFDRARSHFLYSEWCFHSLFCLRIDFNLWLWYLKCHCLPNYLFIFAESPWLGYSDDWSNEVG